ncbi:unnamed protein product [Auanema sp. JU1783]|nr:unnamed protein product [Auanema sp. JU1783]
MLIILTYLLLIGSAAADDSFIFGLHPITTEEQNLQPCSGREPGMYSEGCGPEVLVCQSSDRFYNARCSFGLWFDQEAQVCVNPDDHNLCKFDQTAEFVNSLVLAEVPQLTCNGITDGVHPVTLCSMSFLRCLNGVPTLFECPDGMAYSSEEDNCIDKDELDECQNLSIEGQFRTEDGAVSECERDGIIPSKTCSPMFITCSNGVSHVMSCPPSLVFDRRIQACEFPANVYECQASSLPTDCLEDGLFSFGNCSDKFIACTNGRAITMNCPSELAFDESKQLCDYPFDVAECESSGEESSGEEGSGEEGSGEESSGEEGSGEGSGEEGSGESSGEESGEWSGEESGEAALEEIEEENSGEWSGEEVLASGSETEETSGSEPTVESSGDTLTGTESSGSEPEVQTEAPEIIFRPIDFQPFFDQPTIESSGDSEGSGYGSGVYAYSYGEDDTMNSSGEGSGYESSGVESSGVEEYSGYGMAEVEGSGIEDNSEFLTSLKQVGPERTIALCKGRENGFYSLGCSSLLLSCRNHKSRLLACPYNLIFDEEKGYCEAASNINECVHRKSHHVYENAVTAVPTTTAAYGVQDSLNRLCSNQYDGRVSLGCQSEYLICMGGQALKSSCPEGETIDEPSQKCLALREHSLCSREVYAAQALSGDGTYNEDIDKERKMEKFLLKEEKKIVEKTGFSLENLRGAFPCSEEGAFSKRKCSNKFVFCSGGSGVHLYCDTGMLYSNELKKCVTASDLSECSAENINSY